MDTTVVDTQGLWSQTVNVDCLLLLPQRQSQCPLGLSSPNKAKQSLQVRRQSLWSRRPWMASVAGRPEWHQRFCDRKALKGSSGTVVRRLWMASVVVWHEGPKKQHLALWQEGPEEQHWYYARKALNGSSGSGKLRPRMASVAGRPWMALMTQWK